MAKNVIVQPLGGEKKIDETSNTVGEAKAKVGLASYTATVNGDSASDDQELEDGDFVSLAPAVKGGLI